MLSVKKALENKYDEIDLCVSMLVLYHHTNIKVEAGHFYSIENDCDADDVKVFPIQKFAFEFYDSLENKASTKLFSVESIVNGKRKFVVANFNSFLKIYLKSNYNKRHAYEIVRDNFPCRLYFDIEYSIPLNPDIDGNKLLISWIEILEWHVYEYLGISLSNQNIVDLDSSTEEKFSHHIIVILCDPGCFQSEYLFVNNRHVGDFVSIVLRSIGQLNHGEVANISNDCCPQPQPTSPNFWLRAGDDKVSCFVDRSVYSKNRAFRIFMSSKFSKCVVMKVSPRNENGYNTILR